MEIEVDEAEDLSLEAKAIPSKNNIGFIADLGFYGVRFFEEIPLVGIAQEHLEVAEHNDDDSLLKRKYIKHNSTEPAAQRLVNGCIGLVGVKIAGMEALKTVAVSKVEEVGYGVILDS